MRRTRVGWITQSPLQNITYSAGYEVCLSMLRYLAKYLSHLCITLVGLGLWDFSAHDVFAAT